MIPVPLTWLIIAALGGALAFGSGGFWYGYRYADRASEIGSLEKSLKEANATLHAKALEADNNAKLAQEFRDREQNAASQDKDMQDEIARLTDKLAKKPAADVCNLNDDDLRSLRDLASRARVRAPNTSPASGAVRKSH